MGNTLKDLRDKKSSSAELSDEPSQSITISELKAIFELVRANEVREFSLVRAGGDCVTIKRGVETSAGHTVYSLPASSLLQPGQSEAFSRSLLDSGASEDSVSRAAKQQTAVTLVPEPSLRDITSPMVGTFYRRPAVDAAAYVEVGGRVTKGQVICIIEAMKVMNEIESDCSGTVVEICLSDAQMVEYAEVLFRIQAD